MRCRALLERKQLLSTERFVVDLRGGFDEILEMGACEEVAKVDKLAVPLVFDVDGSPAILTPTNGPAVNSDVVFAANDREWDYRLVKIITLARAATLVSVVLTLICEFIAVSSLSYSSLS